jgi:hypothetical protein
MAVDESGVAEESPSNSSWEGPMKKTYSSPRLLEWGSMTDLTQGALLGEKDFPFKGGTRAT